MPKVCVFYITGHGYGHATRSFQLIKLLIRSKWHVIIVSTISPEFLAQNFGTLGDSVSLENRNLDGGAIQPSPLDIDSIATLGTYFQVHMNRENLIDFEVHFVQSISATLILSDATPLAGVIGSRANVVSILVSNLTWDYIYHAML